MRFSPVLNVWRPWFAWLPVKIGGCYTVAWLEYVERMKYMRYPGEVATQYRFPSKVPCPHGFQDWDDCPDCCH